MLMTLAATVSHATHTVVTSIANLRAIAAPANNDTALLIDYYDPSASSIFPGANRGGGLFRWTTDSTVKSYGEDGGILITNGTTSGIWQRILGGQVPNVRMWGAKGDGSTDDTSALQRALTSIRTFGNHLYFPAGNYKTTATLIFADCLHIEGEGPVNSTFVTLTGSSITNKDIFRTMSADVAIQGNLTALGNGQKTNTTTHKVVDFAHGLIFENISMQFGPDTNTWYAANQTGAGICLAQAGESSIIRNVWVTGGAYGIRCIGGGTPGLKVENSSFFYQTWAGVCVQGIPLASGVDTGSGPITLTSISGDAMSQSQDATASLVQLSNVLANVTITDASAEGSYGNGVFHWYLAENDPDFSSLKIGGGSLRLGGTNSAGYDMLVLTPIGTSCFNSPSVTVEPVNIYSCRYLVKDEFGNRNISAISYWPSEQLPVRRPFQYRSVRYFNTGRVTQFTYGDTAYQTFLPTTTGWYRVINSYNHGYLTGGRLSIGSITDSEEFEFNVDALTDGSINVLRTGKDTGTSDTSPVVTKARAVTYWESNIGGDSSAAGYRTAIELYVKHVPASQPYEQMREVHLAIPIDGRHQWGSEFVDLITPLELGDASDTSLHRTNVNEYYTGLPQTGPVSLLR